MTRPLYLSSRRPTVISNRPVPKAYPTASLVLADSDSGFLPNRLSTIQRNALIDPPTGLLIFNTTENRYEFFDGEQWSPLGTGVGDSESISYGQTDIALALDDIFGLSNLSFYFPLDESNLESIEDRSGNDTPLVIPEEDQEDVQMGVVPSGVPDGRTGMQMHGVQMGIPYREDLWGLKGNNGAWFFHVQFRSDYDYLEFDMFAGSARRFNVEIWANDDVELRVYDSNDDQIHRCDFPDGFIKNGGRALIGVIIDYDNTWRFMINEHVITFRPDLSTTGAVSTPFDEGGFTDGYFPEPITLRLQGGTDSPVISHFFAYPGYGLDQSEIDALLGAFGLSENYLVSRGDRYYQVRNPVLGPDVRTTLGITAQTPNHYYPLNSYDYPSWDLEGGNGGFRFSSNGNRPEIVPGGTLGGGYPWLLYQDELIQTSYVGGYFEYLDDTHMILVDSLADEGDFTIKAEHTDAQSVVHKKWEVSANFYTYSSEYIRVTYYKDDGSPYIEVVSRLRPSVGSKLCLMWGYSSKYDAVYLCVNGVVDIAWGEEGDVMGSIAEPNYDNGSVRIYGEAVAVSHFSSWVGTFLSDTYMRSISGALGYGSDNNYLPIQKPVVNEYFNTTLSISSDHFSLENQGILESTGEMETTLFLSEINLLDWPIGGVIELSRIGAGDFVFRVHEDMDEIYSVTPSGDGLWSPSAHGWRVPAQGESVFIRRRSETQFVIRGAELVEA